MLMGLPLTMCASRASLKAAASRRGHRWHRPRPRTEGRRPDLILCPPGCWQGFGRCSAGGDRLLMRADPAGRSGGDRVSQWHANNFQFGIDWDHLHPGPSAVMTAAWWPCAVVAVHCG